MSWDDEACTGDNDPGEFDRRECTGPIQKFKMGGCVPLDLLRSHTAYYCFAVRPELPPTSCHSLRIEGSDALTIVVPVGGAYPPGDSAFYLILPSAISN